VLNRCSGDKPVTDALELMSNEGFSSLAVIDNALNVIGNISVVDVKVLFNNGFFLSYNIDVKHKLIQHFS
jgi:CBS domain-containing protein